MESRSIHFQKFFNIYFRSPIHTGKFDPTQISLDPKVTRLVLEVKAYLDWEGFQLKFYRRHMTWVLAVSFFSTEFQMEPLALIAISYNTRV